MKRFNKKLYEVKFLWNRVLWKIYLSTILAHIKYVILLATMLWQPNQL